MKLKNILIAVRDIETSKAFYTELFGFSTITDFGGNVILTEGLVLQECKLWENCLDRDVRYGGHDAALYFEENDMDTFLERLENSTFPIEYIDKCVKNAWGRRVIRIYDPDRHVIEISEKKEAGE